MTDRHMPDNADPVFFFVTCHLAPIVADLSGDSDYNPNTARIDATVTFIPKLRSGEVLHAYAADPPTGFLVMPVTAQIDDGYLKLRNRPDVGAAAALPGPLQGLKAKLAADGVAIPKDEVRINPRLLSYAPVKLLGNSDSLNLDPETPLFYDFVFSNVKIDGKASNISITGGTFEAPWETDAVIDLLHYMPLPAGPWAGGMIQGPQGPPGPPGDGTLDFTALTEKTTVPVDPDLFVIGDSAAKAAFDSKKITWARLKAGLKAYFDPTYQAKAEKGVANGYASLDAKTRLPVAQLPLPAVEYKGTWDAATNTPPLAHYVGNQGDMYRVTVAGTQLDLGITARVGDVVFYDGAGWHKLGGADADVFQLKSEKGIANGYATLGSGARMPSSQLPIDAVEYKGTWNAATNTPTLANGAPSSIQGDMYRVSTAGTQLGITVGVGDVVFYDGTTWHKLGAGAAVDGSLYQLKSEKGKASGYAALDAATRLPAAQLPIDAVEYKGTWDAATNTPTLANGVASSIQGDMYRVTVAGTQVPLGIVARVGDVVFYDGSKWHKLGGADADVFQLKSEEGVANGYAGLGPDARVPSAQLTVSAVEYKGGWNAATNTPTLADGVGNQGDMYRVSAAGTQLGITAGVGDVVFYDGTVWYKLGAADASTYQVTSQKGVANGYASLDSGGKVPVAQLPSSLMAYLGVWNATTNTPTLANGTGSPGDVYRVGTAGTQFGISFDVGDYAIYNGTTWEKSDTTDAVASVAGRTGIVTLTKADVGLPLADNTADATKAVLSATKLTPGRKINGVAFDGTVDVTVPISGGDPALAAYQLKSEKAVANGYASLDATGRIPASQLSVSAMEYNGLWNAATNTPTLVNGTGLAGDTYRVSVEGKQFGVTFRVGDFAIYNGSVWERAGGISGLEDIHDLVGKTTPADLDEFAVADSAASWVAKKISWQNIRTAFVNYYNSHAAVLTNKTLNLGSNTVTGTLEQLNAAVTDSDVTGAMRAVTGVAGQSLTVNTVGAPKTLNFLVNHAHNPESSGSNYPAVVQPALYNELAFALERGGVLTITRNGVPAVAGTDYVTGAGARSAPEYLFWSRMWGMKLLPRAATDVFVFELDHSFRPLGGDWDSLYTIEMRQNQVSRSIAIDVWDTAVSAWVPIGSCTNNLAGVFGARKGFANATVTKVRYTLTDFSALNGTWLYYLSAITQQGGPADYLFPRNGGSLYGTTAAGPQINATGATGTAVNLDLSSQNTGVVRANGTQVEIKGHKHVAADVTGARSWATVPASATAAGTAGQEAYDAGFHYVCVTTGAAGAAAWKRTPLTTW